jgi:hypothetical protein
MAIGVGLGDLGCTIYPGGCSLTTATLDIPARGVTLFAIGVSIGTAPVVAPSTTHSLNFSKNTNSMYLPLIAGFP